MRISPSYMAIVHAYTQASDVCMNVRVKVYADALRYHRRPLPHALLVFLRVRVHVCMSLRLHEGMHESTHV